MTMLLTWTFSSTQPSMLMIFKPPAMRVADDQIAENDVAKIARRFRAELERAPRRCGARSRSRRCFRTARRARGLDTNRVVAGVDVAGRDAHAAAAIEIDTVVVAVGVAADGHALDANVFAAQVVADPAR